MPQGYSITTYRQQLTVTHRDWFIQSEACYQAVFHFYYQLLLTKPELLASSSQMTLRALEKQTIPGRDGTVPEHPLPYPKIPLYFRRAAINAAIAAVKSHAERYSLWEKEPKGAPPALPEHLNVSMVYYKGMYKDFDPQHKKITLKLFTGKKWQWLTCSFTGRPFPEDSTCMSPTIVIHRQHIALHIPVKTPVADTRTAKQRVQAGEKAVAVYLTGGELLAVCVSPDQKPLFIRGGKALAGKRRQLTGKARKTGNAQYWQKIRQLNDHTAHQVSRQIIDYALQAQAKIIILPKYGDLNANRKGYLKTTPYDFIGRHIVTNVTYKAWQQGIVITQSYTREASTHCHLCGKPVSRYNETGGREQPTPYGSLYRCPDGHQGNSVLNTALNLYQAFHQAFYQP